MIAVLFFYLYGDRQRGREREKKKFRNKIVTSPINYWSVAAKFKLTVKHKYCVVLDLIFT